MFFRGEAVAEGDSVVVAVVEVLNTVWSYLRAGDLNFSSQYFAFIHSITRSLAEDSVGFVQPSGITAS